MSTDIENVEQNHIRKNRGNGNATILTGAFLVVVGLGMVVRKLDLGIAPWLLSWQTFLIALGLYLGFRHNFRGIAWFVPIVVGVISLQDHLIPDLNLKNYLAPIVLIIIGISFMLRPKGIGSWTGNSKRDYQDPAYIATDVTDSDRIDATSVMGSVKKVIVSKKFAGGDLTSMFGGMDINLSQADFNGRIRMDITNFMAGTKLVVPSSWDVQSDIVAIFGGVEDKRDLRGPTDPNKVLILDGTCFFGGIEIKSY